MPAPQHFLRHGLHAHYGAADTPAVLPAGSPPWDIGMLRMQNGERLRQADGLQLDIINPR